MRATLNEAVPLQALADDGRTDLFVRATILDPALALVTTLFPTHSTKGLYSVNWVPALEGFFSVIFEFFEDALFAVPAVDYANRGESIEVTSEKTNIARLLGLQHENSVLDNQTYNAAKRLLTARLRTYNSAANAVLAGATGLLFEWSITAAYDVQNKATLFRIERVL
jgi:hypothetical protein